jgi:hypothetical protein
MPKVVREQIKQDHGLLSLIKMVDSLAWALGNQTEGNPPVANRRAILCGLCRFPVTSNPYDGPSVSPTMVLAMFEEEVGSDSRPWGPG